MILIRVYYISVKSHSYYNEISKRNSTKTEYLAPQRGLIYDRNGKTLAINELGFSISISPQLSKKSKLSILENELDFLVEHFPHLQKDELKKRYLRLDSAYEHDNIKIVDFIKYEDGIKSFTKTNLRENSFISLVSKRYYPYGSLASHVIGYVGKTDKNEAAADPVAKLVGYTGKTGIEKYYDSVLKGSEGSKKTKVTALNEKIEVISKEEPKNQDIKLSIDIELQKYISELFGKRSGTAIVMDINDGSILAAVSYPEYNLNKFVTGISQEEWKSMIEDFNRPFTNKLVNGLYPPGSVVKMSVAMAFINHGAITPKKIVFCPPFIELGGRMFRDWKSDGHGDTDLKKAIRVSSDVYFYKGALDTGIDNIEPVLKRHGFGVRTGVDLPNEFIGIMPGRSWKMDKYKQPWYHGETLNTAIGQGYFLVTAMQVARNVGMIASGKNLVPHFIREIDGLEIKYDSSSDEIFNDKERAVLPTIKEGMYEVCNMPTGTASRYINSKVKIACKTGTAQVIGISQEEKVRMKESGLDYHQRSHAWLSSYGPYKNPKYVVSVMIEHGESGGRATGDTVSRIYDKLYSLGYIKTTE
jgi:penicillin-binding protein 2